MNKPITTAATGGTAQGSSNWGFELVLLSALWGASFLFTRIGAPEFGALPTACVRVAVASLVLLPLLALRGQVGQLLRHWKALLLVGMLNSGLPFALFSYALLYINTGLAAVLNATTPMFGALVAWVWFGDRPDGSRLTGLVLGFTGVALLAGRSAGLHADAHDLTALLAVLACLAACLFYGLAASATRSYLQNIPPLVTATGSQVGAFVLLAIPAALTWPSQMPSLKAWLALAVLGVACTGIAYILFFRIIAKIGPAKALTVTFLIPVFAMAYGVLLLGEEITPWMVGCAVIVACGTALATGLVKLGRRQSAA